MKNTKKAVIIEIVLILITFIGLSYSFFRAHVNGEDTKNVRVLTHTVDTLTFSVDDNISFEATQQNFINGGESKYGEATAMAILTPNSKTGNCTKNYYLYLNISRNDFGYSMPNVNFVPELLLQVFDSDDNLVTLTGLGDQKTVGTLTGYDITEALGLIPILDNHSITTSNNHSITEEWRIVITLINHDFNQNNNTGCQLVGNIVISEIAPTEPELCTLRPNIAECQFANITANTTSLTNGYLYHHDSTLTNGANDNSFRYSGADPNNYVCFGSNATNCPADNLYRIIGLIPVDVVTDSTTTPVTTERQTLYKLIRHNYETEETLGITRRSNAYSTSNYPGVSSNHPSGVIDGYYWVGNSGNANTWSYSTINTQGLNTRIISEFGGTWSSKIANVLWKFGGNTVDNLIYAPSANSAYQYEIVNPVTTNTGDNKFIFCNIISKLSILSSY